MTPERWTRVEELYHAARARPPGERAAFLAECCLPDQTLLRDVESLLNEPVSGDGFAEGPVVDLHLPVITAAASPAMTGRTLGRYHLQTCLGAGGMGEVYRARDADLERDVAVKVLPTAFTNHPDRLARFEREARMLAALNHPNICGIHGVHEFDGLRFLVLELVEGETLAHRLAWTSRRKPRDGGLPLDEALALGRQIAAALEAAHESGIVHRDLKPANVIVTPDGIVKVLDFGLAKTVRATVASPALTSVPMGTDDAAAGAVLGTAAYMSPEQARGLPVDTRTDIWAFGCVLYEMLTGRVAFAGATASDTVARILEHEPDWALLPAATPPPVRRLLTRCLAKDPKRRLRDIGDARIEIDSVAETQPGDSLQGSALSSGRVRRWTAWVAGVVLVIGLAGWALSRREPIAPLTVTRFTQLLPPGQTLNGSRGAHIVAISPDGMHVAYSGTPYGLYIRAMSSGGISAIPGTETYEATEPVFSPDGRSIVFFAIADQALKTIAVTGGAAQMLCPTAVLPTGISWGPGGIVFGQGPHGVMRVTHGERAPATIAEVAPGETAHGPQVLPGGQHLLFTLARGSAPTRWDEAEIVVQSFATRERRVLLTGASDARYLPTGHLVYAVGGSLYAAPFDVATMTVRGERIPVIEGVRRAAGNFTGAAAYGVAANGSLVYVPGPATPGGPALADIGLMTPDGEVEPLNLPPGPYAFPRVSPDGSRLAFEIDDGKEASVYTYELSGASAIQRLSSSGNNHAPVWASNARIAYQSDREGDAAVWWQALDGSAERLTRPEPGTSHTPESWSGDTLLFSVTAGAEVSLRAFSLRDRRTAAFGLRSSAATGAVFSPDGRWVAYSVTADGAVTLYAEPFPSAGVRYPLAAKLSDTPKHPRWSRDGHELFYNPNAGTHESVRVTRSPFAFGKAVTVAKRLAGGPAGSRTPYDTTPDGRLIGIITAGRSEYVRGSDREIHVVLNWFEELKARVPPH